MVDDSADKDANTEELVSERNGGRDSNRDELEKRLAEFALDIRANAADAQKSRRAATPLEKRLSATNVKLPQSRAPEQKEELKVVIASGLDPHREPTLVGQRDEHKNRWDFGADGEMVDALESPDSPDNSISIGQPRQEASHANIVRARRSRGALFVLTGVLLVAALFWLAARSSETKTLVMHQAVSNRILSLHQSRRMGHSVPSPLQTNEGKIDTQETPAPSNAASMVPLGSQITGVPAPRGRTSTRRGVKHFPVNKAVKEPLGGIGPKYR